MSGTTWVSRYQEGKTRKVKTNLDLLEQEIYYERQWHLLGYMQVCTSSQTTTPTSHYSVFLQSGCPSCRPTNSVKALKEIIKTTTQKCLEMSSESVTLSQRHSQTVSHDCSTDSKTPVTVGCPCSRNREQTCVGWLQVWMVSRYAKTTCYYRFLLVSVSPSSSISCASSSDPSTSLPSECRRRRSFFSTWHNPPANEVMTLRDGILLSNKQPLGAMAVLTTAKWYIKKHT